MTFEELIPQKFNNYRNSFANSWFMENKATCDSFFARQHCKRVRTLFGMPYLCTIKTKY